MIVSGSGTKDSPIAIDDDSEDEVLNELVNVLPIDLTPPVLSPRRGTFLAELPPHLLSGEVVRGLEQFREQLQLQVKKRKRGVTPLHEDPNGSGSNTLRLPLEDRLSESKPESSKQAKKRRKKNREAAKAEAYIQRNKPYEVQFGLSNPNEHGRFTILSSESAGMAPFTVGPPRPSSSIRTAASLGPFVDHSALTHNMPLNYPVTPHEFPPTHVPPANRPPVKPQSILKPVQPTSSTHQQSHYPIPSTRPSSAQPSGYSVLPSDQPLRILPPSLFHMGPSMISPIPIDMTMGLHTIPVPMVNPVTRERQRPPHMTLPTSTISHLDIHHIHQQNLPIFQSAPSSLPPRPTFLPQSNHASTALQTAPYAHIGKPSFSRKQGVFPILRHMLPDPEKPYLPNVKCTLVMEQLPKPFCNVPWITAWSQNACGTAPVCILLAPQKALVEYRSVDLAMKAWGSPRLGADENGQLLDGHSAEYNVVVYRYQRNKAEEARLTKMWEVAGSDEAKVVNTNAVPPPSSGPKEGMAKLQQVQGQQGKLKGGVTTGYLSVTDQEMWAKIEASRAKKEQLKPQRKVGVERGQKQQKVEEGKRGKEGGEKSVEKSLEHTGGEKTGQSNKRKRNRPGPEAETSEKRRRVDNERREGKQALAGETVKPGEKGKQGSSAKLTQKDVLKKVATSQQKQQQQQPVPSTRVSTTQKPSLAPKSASSVKQRLPSKPLITPRLSSSQIPSSAVPHPDSHNTLRSQASDASSRRMDLDSVIPPSSMTLPSPSSSSVPSSLPLTPFENALKSLSLQGGTGMDTTPDHAVVPAAGTYLPHDKRANDKTESAKVPSGQEFSVPGLSLHSRPIPSAPRSFLNSSQNLSRSSSSINTRLGSQIQKSSSSHLSKKQDSIPKQQESLEQKLARAREELAQSSRSGVSMDLDMPVQTDMPINSAGAGQRKEAVGTSRTIVAGEEKLAVTEFRRIGKGLLKQQPDLGASLSVPVLRSSPPSESITPTAEELRKRIQPRRHPRPQSASGSESRPVAAPVANSVPPLISSSPSTGHSSTPVMMHSVVAPQEPEKHGAGPLRLTLDSSLSLPNSVAQRYSPEDMEVSPISQGNEPELPQDKSGGVVTSIHVSAQAGSVMSATGNQVQQPKQSSGSIVLDFAPLLAPNASRMLSKQSLATKQKLLEEEIKATKVLMAKIAEARTKQERERLMAMLREKSRSMDEVSNSIKNDTLVSTGQYSQQMKGWLRMRWPESREDVGVLIISDDEDEVDGS